MNLHHVTHFLFSHLSSSLGVLESNDNPQSQPIASGQAHSSPTIRYDGMPVHTMDGVDMRYCQIFGGSTKEGGKVSPLQGV